MPSSKETMHSTQFTESESGYKFLADIYEGGSGWYEMTKRGNQLYCREDATLEDWIGDVETKLSELAKLRNFLKEVRYQQKMQLP